jgi:hypothetical protein
MRHWIVALALACSGCVVQSHACGCGDIFNFFAHVPDTPEMLADDTVLFCQNGACATGVLPAPSPTAADGAKLTGAFDAGAGVVAEGTGAQIGVGPVGALQFVDGDVYRIAVTTPSALTVIDKSVVATYVEKTVCDGQCHEFDFAADVYP